MSNDYPLYQEFSHHTDISKCNIDQVIPTIQLKFVNRMVNEIITSG